MEIIALPKAQRLYTYANSQQISMQTGLIGHLRADFGGNGKQFFSSFFDFRKDLKSDAFKDEINTVFDFLREGSNYVDKNGAEIREHDFLQFEDGTEKEVFRLQDGSLGISVSNPAYLAAHPNAEEYYSTLSGWAPDGGIKKATDGAVDFARRPNRQEKAYVSCGSVLKSRSALSAFCAAHPECGFAGNYTQEFGIRVNTPDYAYLLRLNPTKGDYNIYCYCYRRDWLDHHLQQAQKGIRFITPNYQTLFTLSDGDQVRILNAQGGCEDKTVRYVDDYHAEIGMNLYHICEFAERMEQAGSKGLIPLRASLPDKCYTVAEGTASVAVIEKGKPGYVEVQIPSKSIEEADSLASYYNKNAGVTPAQFEAMKAGSMFGWDSPAADPKNYDENGVLFAHKSPNRGDAR